jgi:AraC-like DNA-binding protein
MAGRPPLTFSTRGLAVASRRRALRRLREQGLLPVEPLSDAAPHVDLVKWHLPGASVLRGSFAGVRQEGVPGADDVTDDMFFGINVSGAGLARQRAREITVGAGDAVVVDLREGPFTIVRPELTRMFGLRVRRELVPVDADRLGDPALRLVPGRTTALQLLTRYLRSVLDGGVPPDSPLADAVVTHLSELIALSLVPGDASSVPATAPSVRAARLAAIKSDIVRHLTDGSLSAAAVGRRQHITTRYLHKLFEDEPTTYSRFVLDRRLELVHRRLRDPTFAGRSISSIATDAGFGDLSYFNRTFRRRYGTTPSDVRRPR